jgi:hypothetical protein
MGPHWTTYAGVIIPVLIFVFGLAAGGIKWCFAMYATLQEIKIGLGNLVQKEKKNEDEIEVIHDKIQNHEVRLTLQEKRSV